APGGGNSCAPAPWGRVDRTFINALTTSENLQAATTTRRRRTIGSAVGAPTADYERALSSWKVSQRSGSGPRRDPHRPLSRVKRHHRRQERLEPEFGAFSDDCGARIAPH